MRIPNATPLQRALALLEQGQASEALVIASVRLLEQPESPDWLTVQGLAFSALKRADDAVLCYRRLCELQPSIPEHFANLGNALLELGHPQAARGELIKALELGGDDANVWYGLARCSYESMEPVRARDEVVRALKGGLGQDLEVALFYIKCLIATDEIELAKDNAARLARAPFSPALACDYAFLVLQLSDYEGAERICLTVPQDTEQYPMALISLALSYERSNQMPKALAAREQLRALHANFAPDAPLEVRLSNPVGQSLIQLDARLLARKREFAHSAALLQALLANVKLDAHLKIAIQFELARALDEIGKSAEAYELLHQAHQLRLAQVTAAHPKMAKEHDPLLLLEQAFEPAHTGTTRYHLTDFADPVFVVGFPRSGTTLLEQLLHAHPALQSFDERSFLQQCILRMQDQQLAYPADLPKLSSEQRADLRQHYFSLCQSISPGLPEGARYVDKNPLNISRLPMVQALFPDAKIIVVLRHPADCVLSCYMQHFRAPAFAVTMQSLDATAVMYHRVFDFYRNARGKLGLSLFELRYEDLVSNTEEMAKSLFQFLELPWIDDLMNFTERAKSRQISTPSYSAVTEKVNKRAVNRWRRFESQFVDSGALPILDPWIKDFGYSDS